MKPDEIKATDWHRILLGEVPPEFYLELVIRAILVYALLQISMRLLGKRMSSQTSLIDMTAMVSLAAAIGVPMLSYDRGILPAFIIAFVVVGITRLFARLNFLNQRFEKTLQGDIDCLVEDSKLNLKAMAQARLSHDRVFSHLRAENIYQLGAVKRMYQEANGSFTIVKNEPGKPGLNILPHWDTDFIGETLLTTDISICAVCGNELPGEDSGGRKKSACPRCKSGKRTQAVVEKEETI